MMHLLFCANDAYVPHVATTLASIFENNNDIPFCVHLLTTYISEQNSGKLVSFVNKYNHIIDIKTVNPNDFDIDESVCGKWGIFPSLKLYAADLFSDVDRLLYVDADMICLGSLQALLDINLDNTNYYASMVTDDEASINHKHRLGLNENVFYGCAGLVYLNLEKWRRDKIREKCMTYFNDPKNRHTILFGEQDVMNVVLQGNIRELPIEYNMMSMYWKHYDNRVPAKYKQTIQKHRKEAIIIHYIGDVKPWHKDCHFPLKKYYWKYHSITPWRHEKYGYSPEYKGFWVNTKESIHHYLHRLGIECYFFGYDC